MDREFGDTSMLTAAQIESINFAVYKNLITGWGYFTSPQVNFLLLKKLRVQEDNV